MVEALADRLAEAFAERLHQIVRKELWAYAPHEDFSTEDLLKVKYQGTASQKRNNKVYTVRHHDGRLCAREVA